MMVVDNLSTTTSAFCGYAFRVNGGNAYILAQSLATGATDFVFINDPAGPNTEVMRIKSDGKVGIGTDAPNEALTVVGDISATTDLHAGNNAIITNDLTVGTNVLHVDQSDSQVTMGATAGIDTNSVLEIRKDHANVPVTTAALTGNGYSQTYSNTTAGGYASMLFSTLSPNGANTGYTTIGSYTPANENEAMFYIGTREAPGGSTPIMMDLADNTGARFYTSVSAETDLYSKNLTASSTYITQANSSTGKIEKSTMYYGANGAISVENNAVASQDLYLESNVSADGSTVATLYLAGENSVNGSVNYGYVKSDIIDRTSTSEDGKVIIGAEAGGTATDIVSFDGGTNFTNFLVPIINIGKGVTAGGSGAVNFYDIDSSDTLNTTFSWTSAIGFTINAQGDTQKINLAASDISCTGDMTFSSNKIISGTNFGIGQTSSHFSPNDLYLSAAGSLYVPQYASSASLNSTNNGSLFYDTTDNKFYFRENGAWSALGGGGGVNNSFMEAFSIQSIDGGAATADKIFASKFVPAYDITATKMSVFVTNAQSDNITVGIWDSGGTLLISTSAATTTADNGLFTITLSASQALTGGTEYWMSPKIDGGSITIGAKTTYADNKIAYDKADATTGAMTATLTGGSASTSAWYIAVGD
jgi:hypothetical protein